MASHVSSKSVFEQMQHEHELLRERIKVLHQTIDLRQASLEEVVRLLQDLRDVLDIHFSEEECGGFFDQIVARAPQLSRQAKHLTEEHVQLLQETDSLIRFAARGTGQPICWRTLALRFQDFSKLLMHHESDENGMLQRAYQEDLGTKD